MKVLHSLYSIVVLLSFIGVVYPDGVSQVQFSIMSDNGMNPFGAKKYTEYSGLGVKMEKMKIGYSVNHPTRTSQQNYNFYNKDIPKVPQVQIPAAIRKTQYQHPSTNGQYNNDHEITYQSYPFYEPYPITTKRQNQPASYQKEFFSQMPSAHQSKPKLQYSQLQTQKRLVLPKVRPSVSSATHLPAASPYATQQNRNIGVHLNEALDKSVPFIYY